MSRWLIAKVNQETLDKYVFNIDKKTKSIIDQKDLFNSFYDISHTEEIADSKAYDVTIYEQKFSNINWQTKEELKSTMIFDKLVAQKTLELSSDLLKALDQIKQYLFENSDFLFAYKVIIDDAVYYMVNCSKGSSLTMELCKDEDTLAGKLLDCIIRANKNKGL